MFNIAIAFILLAGLMYLAFRTVDVVLAQFNLFSQRYKSQDETEQSAELLANSLQPAEYSTYNHQAIASCETETGSVCSEIANNAEGLAESVGEHVSTILEGLSHH